MCTFIYLPQPDGTLVVGSNRDERRSRSHARPPAPFRTPRADALSPLDPDGNGAWLAADARGFVVCLLNGATAPHTPNPPYRMSRGRVVIETLSAADPFDFLTEPYCQPDPDPNPQQPQPHHGLEPFTLVICRPGRLQEHRWDGYRLTTRHLLANVPHIWSAATLYTPQVVRAKEAYFAAWVATRSRTTPADAVSFLTTGRHPEWGLPLPLGTEGGTVSTSALVVTSSDVRWTYYDHLAAHLANEQKSAEAEKISPPVTTLGLHRTTPADLVVPTEEKCVEN